MVTEGKVNPNNQQPRHPAAALPPWLLIPFGLASDHLLDSKDLICAAHGCVKLPVDLRCNNQP